MTTEARQKRVLIARHTERKMSPSTGIENNYVHEYYLISKPKDAGAEWMGNEWGVEGVFMVGNEERSRELLEVGMTPIKVIKSLPWETTYIHADKFGLAKKEYDKVMNERQAKKDAEQRAKELQEKEDVEGIARYESAIKELGSTKGVKEQKIVIKKNVSNDWKYNRMVDAEVDGAVIGNGIGLAYSVSPSGRTKKYTITHLRSGLAFGDSFDRRSDAVAAAKMVAQITDWGEYKSDKEATESGYLTDAARIVRGFKNKKLELPKEKNAKQHRIVLINNDPRSKIAIATDKALLARTVTRDRERWAANRSSVDYRGMDTPTKKKPHKINKRVNLTKFKRMRK